MSITNLAGNIARFAKMSYHQLEIDYDELAKSFQDKIDQVKDLLDEAVDLNVKSNYNLIYSCDVDKLKRSLMKLFPNTEGWNASSWCGDDD